MRYAGHFVRKGILTKLVNSVDIGNGAIPVYGRVPDSTSYPYVIVSTSDATEIDQNQSSFTSVVNTNIEIVTRYATDDGGQLKANEYASKILTLIRTRSAQYMDLSEDGFSVYGQEMGTVTNIEEPYSDYYYYRTVISLVVKVQEIDLQDDIPGLQNDLQFDLQS